MQAAKNFAQVESSMDNSAHTLKKIELLRQHMGYQCDSMTENAKKIEFLKEQVEAMERWAEAVSGVYSREMVRARLSLGEFKKWYY